MFYLHTYSNSPLKRLVKTPKIYFYDIGLICHLTRWSSVQTLENGRVSISNNLCEANIKPFATARRAWLLADTPKGAKPNVIVYTLVESTRANKSDVYEYLKHLLTGSPNNHYLEHPEVLDQYLPWLKSLPEKYLLEHQHKNASINDSISIAEPCFIY